MIFHYDHIYFHPLNHFLNSVDSSWPIVFQIQDKSIHVASVTSTSPSGGFLLDHQFHQQQQNLTLSPTGAKLGCVQLTSGNRSRLMFDPLSELPMLEKWFDENPHPSWVQIDQITDTLNGMTYRLTYPRVSSHNVKIWWAV